MFARLDKAATSTAKSLAIYKDIFVSNSNLCKNKNYRMISEKSVYVLFVDM